MDTFTIILVSVGLFVAGLGFAYLTRGLASRIGDRIDPLWHGLFLLILGVLTPIVAYGLSRYLGNQIIFFGGVFVSGFLLLGPILFMVSIYLVWWNPRKYKEYEMKKRRRERQQLESSEEE